MLSVSSQLDIYVALVKCKIVALSVLMPLNSRMPDVLQQLHGLLKNLICARCAYIAPGGTHFFVFAMCCSILGDKALCSGLSR